MEHHELTNLTSMKHHFLQSLLDEITTTTRCADDERDIQTLRAWAWQLAKIPSNKRLGLIEHWQREEDDPEWRRLNIHRTLIRWRDLVQAAAAPAAPGAFTAAALDEECLVEEGDTDNP